MRKIPSLFQRNYDGDRLVRDEVTSGCEWVLAGEGVATRKWDGTCCLVRDGRLFKRYDAKHGKTPPANFEPAQDPDPVTGHWTGWVPVGDGPEDRWHREAFARCQPLDDGTYELCGPHFQANPEGLAEDTFIYHGIDLLPRSAPRTFDGLRDYLATANIEGIVWWHTDGKRLCKIKTRDLGLKRGASVPVGVGAGEGQ